MLLNEVLQGVQRQQDRVKSGKVTLLEAVVLSQDLASPQSCHSAPYAAGEVARVAKDLLTPTHHP